MADEMDFDDLEGSKISDETTIEIATAMLKNLTDVACPTVIIGSRLEDPDGFKGMLELAQAGAESGMNELPPEAEFLRDSWKVIDEENNFFMTLNLNLAELPLEEMLAEVNDAELVAAIEEFVLNKQCSVALGITDNLLLLGIANNAEKLTKFGSQDKLIDLPQLAQAETSQAEAETMSKELASSLLELAEDLKTVWPEPALRYGFAKLDAEGIRGHTFRGSKHPFLDGSKPLELADHAGPETVLLLANRPRDLSKQYGLGAKWVSRCYQALKARGIEEAIDAVEKARAQQQKASGKSGARDLMEDDPPEVESPEVESPEENQVWREKGPKIIDLLESIAKKIDQTTRQRFLPAIDGQEVGLFVELVDGPKSWHPDIPQTETLLPLPLPALITEHNDQADLVLAAEEYLDHAAEFYKGVEAIDAEFPEDKSEVTPDQTWKFTMEKSETTLGTLFQLPVVPESKLDSSVRPGVLITKDKMVAAVLQKQAADLSQPRTANLFGPASEKKPSFSVFFYDNRALMKGIETWNTIALEVAEEAALEQDVSFDLSQYEAERDTLQFSEEQLKDYFQGYWNLGGCWKGISSRSYAQGEGAAADFLLKFSDVEPVK